MSLHAETLLYGSQILVLCQHLFVVHLHSILTVATLILERGDFGVGASVVVVKEWGDKTN